MQTYQVNPIDSDFFAFGLTLLLILFFFLARTAFTPLIFVARQKALYRLLSEREQYFRDLREGKVKERKKGDKWRSDYPDEIEFEDFLTSIWRDSEFWYPRRRAEFYLFERERKFIIHKGKQSSPIEGEMDSIEYVV